MEAISHSSSELLTALFAGRMVRGHALARDAVRFGDYTVTLTAPNAPRMPNGIEVEVVARPGARVAIGRGRLVVGRVEVTPGPNWDPVPAFARIACHPAGLPPMRSGPAASAVLAGYVAGLVLLHGQRSRASDIAERAIPSADALGATMLRHAAHGEVPGPVHELLGARDPSRLLSWAPLGVGWLRGFISAGLPLDLGTARIVDVRRTA